MRSCARGPIGAAAVVLLFLVAGCGGPDPTRVTVCAEAAAVLAGVSSVRVLKTAGTDDNLRLEHDHGHITCTFAAADPILGRTKLRRVVGGDDQPLSPWALFFLERYGLPEAAPPSGGTLGRVPYFLQQLVNATGLAAIYAVIALGYALIYGIVGRINLAFGEFASFGTFAALAGAGLASLGGGGPAWSPLLVVLVAAGCGGLLGLVVDRLVFRPLHARSSLALLIATIGLSLSLSEGMRVASGSSLQWLPPSPLPSLTLWSDGLEVVALGAAPAIAALVAVLVVAGIAWLLARTGFGRAWRAVADDPLMAALCGISVRRLISTSCILGSACAGLGGAFVASEYGVVGFDSGRLLGFKALVAAILGGIGAPLGAALGGLVLALLETLWAAYLSGVWRDSAIFVLLALLLALRPQGLFGEADPRDGPGVSRGRRNF